MHFCQGGVPVGEEHQSKLAQYQIKVAIWEQELLSAALTPFDGQTQPFVRCTSHREHVWIEIEADDPPTQTDTWSNAPGDNARSAGYIQDALTRLRIRRLNQVRCLWSEQSRHHIALIRLCRITQGNPSSLALPAWPEPQPFPRISSGWLKLHATSARASRGYDNLVNDLKALRTLKFVQGLFHFTPNFLALGRGKRRN